MSLFNSQHIMSLFVVIIIVNWSLNKWYQKYEHAQQLSIIHNDSIVLQLCGTLWYRALKVFQQLSMYTFICIYWIFIFTVWNALTQVAECLNVIQYLFFHAEFLSEYLIMTTMSKLASCKRIRIKSIAASWKWFLNQ